MEKYKIIDRIGTGVLSFSYTCTQKDNNQHLVLKELECQDMTNAQRALEEFKIFHKLDHRFLTKIKDTFVKWDKKTETTYVVYTMNYYRKGTLASYLNILRANQQTVPFKTVRKWLANLVEAVSFLHQNQIVHRNLKPGSCYFKNQDADAFHTELKIGDYGVLTIMNDARTKTRILNGAFDYVAPEIIDTNLFDFKSDVWTIGTILLDVCTTGIYNPKQLHLHLLNVRHDEELLDRIIDEIYTVYESKSLGKIIKKILNLNSEKRPSIKAVINDDFVQECLELIRSHLAIVFKQPHETYQSDNLSEPKSLDKLFTKLHRDFQIESRVAKITADIARVIHKQEAQQINTDERDLLFRLLDVYSANPQIQLATLDIIGSTFVLFVSHTRLDQKKKGVNLEKPLEHEVIKNHFVENFFYVFLKYDNVSEIQLSAIKVIIQLAYFENISNELASYDVIKYLLSVLSNYESDPVMCGYVCKAIWCLSIHDKIMQTLPNKNCLAFMREVLLKHQNDLFSVQMACNVVIAMCTNERLISQEEIEVDVTSAILQGLKHQLDSSSVVRSACMAFCSLIVLFEECAFRFLYLSSSGKDEDDIEGLQLLKRAYYKHKDESEIVEHICNVYKELCNYDEMVVEMKSFKLHETLINEIEKRYRDNLEISELCFIVNAKIEEKIKQDILAADNA